MSVSIREFFERLASIEIGKITTIWSSVLRYPDGDDIPVLTATGEVLLDKLAFDEDTPCYGSALRFENMSHEEVVTSSRICRSLHGGVKVFVESLM